MKKLVLAFLFLASTACAENICLTATGATAAPNCSAAGALEVSVTNVTGVELPAGEYLKATDNAGTGTNSLLKGGTDDDTYLNCDSGELIKLSENGTSALSFDPSAGVFSYSADILFSEGANPNLTIDADGDADDVNLLLGQNATTAPVFTIRGQTTDGDDDGWLCLTPGGACDAADQALRGANLKLYGADETTETGKALLTSSGVIKLMVTGSTGISMGTNGYVRWWIPSESGDGVSRLMFQDSVSDDTYGEIVANPTNGDGHDEGSLCLSGGGFCGDTGRGSYAIFYGRDHASEPGKMFVKSQGVMDFTVVGASTLQFGTNNTLRWYISAGGILTDSAGGGIKSGGAMDFSAGTTKVASSAQAALGSCVVGQIKVCVDCGADCSTGSGTGRICACTATNTWM